MDGAWLWTGCALQATGRAPIVGRGAGSRSQSCKGPGRRLAHAWCGHQVPGLPALCCVPSFSESLWAPCTPCLKPLVIPWGSIYPKSLCPTRCVVTQSCTCPLFLPIPSLCSIQGQCLLWSLLCPRPSPAYPIHLCVSVPGPRAAPSQECAHPAPPGSLSRF